MGTELAKNGYKRLAPTREEVTAALQRFNQRLADGDLSEPTARRARRLAEELTQYLNAND